MQRLEDIPKKDVFEAPEGYFDKLPGIIQSRIATQPKAYSWNFFARLSLKYALPTAVIATALYFLVAMPSHKTPEEMIASIDTDNLVAYLAESDLTTEDILDNVPLDEEDVNIIQDKSMGDFVIDSTLIDFPTNGIYEN